MKTRHILVLVAAALPLAGCIDESASMIFSDKDHALTLNVRQPWLWSKDYELEAIMEQLPDCHRRSRMDNAPLGTLRVEVFRPPQGVYEEPILILRQGDAYYALSEMSCEMQRFKTMPTQTGANLGSFDMEDGKLQFVAAPARTEPQQTPQ